MQEMVTSGGPPRAEWLRAWATSRGIPDADLIAFIQLALSLLTALHEGSLARYGLRPSEYAAWRALYPRRRPA